MTKTIDDIKITNKQMIAIVGPNNSYKTTALKNILNDFKKEKVIFIDNDHYELMNDINSNIKCILIDDLCNYSTKKETKSIVNKLKKLKKDDITIVVTTLNLESVIDFDYIYIINDKEIVIEGRVSDVFIKDNILARLGLDIPFMYDLSVKLNDYDILNGIELDMDRMVDKIWK